MMGSGLKDLRLMKGTDRLDIGGTYLMVPGANYGFGGAQFQYNILSDTERYLVTAAL